MTDQIIKGAVGRQKEKQARVYVDYVIDKVYFFQKFMQKKGKKVHRGTLKIMTLQILMLLTLSKLLRNLCGARKRKNGQSSTLGGRALLCGSSVARRPPTCEHQWN